MAAESKGASAPEAPADRLAQVVSPLLSGVNPRSLDALMAEDPAKLSELEFDQVMDELRRLRRVYMENEAGQAKAEGEAAAKPRGKGAKRPAGTIQISLGDLFPDGD